MAVKLFTNATLTIVRVQYIAVNTLLTLIWFTFCPKNALFIECNTNLAVNRAKLMCMLMLMLMSSLVHFVCTTLSILFNIYTNKKSGGIAHKMLINY